MNAAVVEQYGTPRHRAFEEPAASEGRVVVEVAAAGINPVDVARAAGTFYAGRAPLPFVAGSEGVGRLADGRRVYFDKTVHPFGSMAERTLVEPDGLIDVPEELDDGLAVAIGIAGLAGWLPLSWRAELKPGETVLVLGATGIVGAIAVQAAKLLGAGRVVAAGRNPAALERAAALGADATVALPPAAGAPADPDASAPAGASAADDPDAAARAREALTAAIREAAEGDVDVVVDPLWGEPALAALGALGLGGRLIQIGQSAGATAPVPSAHVRGKLAEIRGHTNFLAPYEMRAEAYRAMAAHAAAGRIAVDVERIPLRDVEDAWERQRSGGHGKKLVLIP